LKAEKKTKKTKITKTKKTKKKITMSPIGLTVSCKSPPHIRACIDSGSPIWHALTQVPVFGHALTPGVKKKTKQTNKQKTKKQKTKKHTE
jgi:hypothetical protein